MLYWATIQSYNYYDTRQFVGLIHIFHIIFRKVIIVFYLNWVLTLNKIIFSNKLTKIKQLLQSSLKYMNPNIKSIFIVFRFPGHSSRVYSAQERPSYNSSTRYLVSCYHFCFLIVPTYLNTFHHLSLSSSSPSGYNSLHTIHKHAINDPYILFLPGH